MHESQRVTFRAPVDQKHGRMLDIVGTYTRVGELEGPACVHRDVPEVSVASTAAEAELEMMLQSLQVRMGRLIVFGL